MLGMRGDGAITPFALQGEVAPPVKRERLQCFSQDESRVGQLLHQLHTQTKDN